MPSRVESFLKVYKAVIFFYNSWFVCSLLLTDSQFLHLSCCSDKTISVPCLMKLCFWALYTVFSLARWHHIISCNCLGHSLTLLFGLKVWPQCTILYTSFYFPYFRSWYAIVIEGHYLEQLEQTHQQFYPSQHFYLSFRVYCGLWFWFVLCIQAPANGLLTLGRALFLPHPMCIGF